MIVIDFSSDILGDVVLCMACYALGGVKPQEQVVKSKKKNTELRNIIPILGVYVSKIMENLADQVGLEPTTNGFGDRCSTI